jgi:plastocyanin
MFRNHRIEYLVLIVLMVGVVAGCAGGGHVRTEAAPLANGSNLVTIEAGSYKFKPNEIRVAKPGTLVLEIKNVSGSEHNFTLKNSRGEILKSLNIRAKATAISNVDLEPGTYQFNCDKKFHAKLGMKGQIIVETAK